MKNKLKRYALVALMAAIHTSLVAAPQKPMVTIKPSRDIGVVNEARIEYWLKKRGEISTNASENEVREAVLKFQSGASQFVAPEFVRIQSKNAIERQLKKTKQLTQSKLSSQAAKTVKVLAVMIDFPDLPYNDNRLTANDTDMYYPDYPVEHYQNLMFSTSGVTGPGGQTLLSGYQFYQAESGDEFFFTGDSYGWVTADNNAATYGANSVDDDNDINTADLIKEAVEKAVLANTINLADYDLEDPFDIDADGNTNEADGFIDHVMVYHSSIGEEAGGGVLGDEAIWSHRFFINSTGSFETMGYEINGSGINLFGYTIQPIDAATGVVVHEFGHDLGLPDEYDTGEEDKGSPVGRWSVMSGGSWTGTLAGTQPVGFSTYGRSELQRLHGTNWINETEIDFENFSTPQTINLVEAINHAAGTINQVKINLANPDKAFNTYAGDFQYYSTKGDDLNNSLSFSLSIPDSAAVSLTMKARWDIEEDWDYARVLVNDTAIAGNHTIAVNQYSSQYPEYEGVVNYISGKSEDIAGAEGADFWVDLTYDVSAFRGQTVTIKFDYITDSNTGGYGFAVDEIALLNNASSVYHDGAEMASTVTLNGFQRNNGSIEGDPQNYWIQLRSHNGIDAGLATRSYDQGVVVWFSDSAYANNQSAAHPGAGLIGVVDADQNLIGTRSSSIQVRDAAFSTFMQSSYSGDNSLTPSFTFDDQTDYSSPAQPQSGIILPVHGLRIDITEQATDSSTATIQISKQVILGVVSADYSSSISGNTVTFTNSSSSTDLMSYTWDFGDESTISTDTNPTHTYAAEGIYEVLLTATNTVSPFEDSISKSIRVGSLPEASFSHLATQGTVVFTNTSTGGIGALTHIWDFGDGSASTVTSPTHTYTASGNFNVKLTTTDSVGTITTINVRVRVIIPAPEPEKKSGGGAFFWGLIVVLGLTIKQRIKLK